MAGDSEWNSGVSSVAGVDAAEQMDDWGQTDHSSGSGRHEMDSFVPLRSTLPVSTDLFFIMFTAVLIINDRERVSGEWVGEQIPIGGLVTDTHSRVVIETVSGIIEWSID